MFLDEARLCGRIRHPNVVPTLDVVATEGELFLVMEYVAGESLAKLLKTACAAQHDPDAAARRGDDHLVGAPRPARGARGEGRARARARHRPSRRLPAEHPRRRRRHVARPRLRRREGRGPHPDDARRPDQGQDRVHAAGAAERRPRHAAVDIYAAVGRPLGGAHGASPLRRRDRGRSSSSARSRARSTRRACSTRSSTTRRTPSCMRGLARDPEQRFATARDMALAIEQTIGLASPYEVGEWVESVAADGDRPSRAHDRRDRERVDDARARRASVSRRSRPSLRTRRSRASPSRGRRSPSHAPQRSRRFARTFAATAGASRGRRGPPRRAWRCQEKLTGGAAPGRARTRSLATASAASRSSSRRAHCRSSVQRRTAVAAAEPTKPPPFVRQPASASSHDEAEGESACDPPFTIDPATGRKKYKIECLK